MKKISLLILIAMTLCNITIAQKRVETFDNNLFNWEEIAEKKKSATIQDGYLVLDCKKAGDAIAITTRFPIQVEQNFKITAKLFIPKIDEKHFFGICTGKVVTSNDMLANLEEEEKKELADIIFMLSENNYAINCGGDIKRGKVILKGGKDKTVTMVVERKGGTMIFSLNGMTVTEMKGAPRLPRFGFFMTGKGTIKVDEVTVEQYLAEE